MPLFNIPNVQVAETPLRCFNGYLDRFCKLYKLARDSILYALFNMFLSRPGFGGLQSVGTALSKEFQFGRGASALTTLCGNLCRRVIRYDQPGKVLVASATG